MANNFETNVQEQITLQFMHLINLPFLSRDREQVLEQNCRDLGWTEENIAHTKAVAIKRSNWSRNSYIRDNLEREQKDVSPMFNLNHGVK